MYLYRWNHAKKELEVFPGELNSYDEWDREGICVVHYESFICENGGGIDLDDTHYDYQIVLKRDDEMAIRVFADELQYKIAEAEKAIESMKMELTALQEMGA